MRKLYSLKKAKTFALALVLGFASLPQLSAAPTADDQAVMQQNSKAVTVVVSDPQGEPIIGAIITLKGTSRQVATDANGAASIKAEPNDVLTVNFMGFVPAELTVTTQGTYKVALVEDAISLSDVVVVGYGTQTKANLTGSVAQVSGTTLEDRPITNLSQGLQGLVPGMVVITGQGRPGQDGGSINIRGVGTLNNSAPFILIDGIEAGSMNQVDPNDVASISVLKDAASAAIYGSKASNGVILITTKRGKVGKARVTYNGNFGIQNATALVDRLSSGDYGRLYNQALVANGKKPKFTPDEIELLYNGKEPYKYPNTDWYSLAYKTGFQHTHNVNISGGTETVRYMASVGYLGQKGIMPNASRDQFNIRTNVDATLSKKFTARVNLAYINNSYSDPVSSYGVGDDSYQIIRQINLISPWIVNQYQDGTYGTISDGNPIAWLNSGQKVQRDNQNILGIAALDYNIIDGLKFTVQGSYVSNMQNLTRFMKDIQYNPNKYHGPNELSERYYTWNRAAFDALLNYDKQFGDHGLKVLAGFHSEAYTSKELIASRTTFANNDLTDMNAGTASTQKNSGYSRQLNMISWFGRINYDYQGKYLLEANFRADASSRFSPSTRWGFFPSFSAGWRISQENFMDGAQGWLQSLKIRGSWGQLGNQNALASEYYPWMSTYKLGTNAVLGGNLISGTSQTKANFENISWERATSYGVGLDALLFKGLSVSLDWYVRETAGIIMEVPVPETFGLSPYLDNVGGMRNEGVEASIGYNNKWGDWTFGAGFNFGYNKNTVTSLGGVDEMANGNFIRKVGREFDSYYIYQTDGIFQSQKEADDYTAKYGNPFNKKFMAGDLRYVVDPEKGGKADPTQKGKLNAEQRVIGNSTMPKFNFGLNLNVGFKGFDLSMMFSGVAGVSRYFDRESFGEFSGDAQHPASVWLDAWSETNKGGKFPYVSDGQISPSTARNISSFWVFNTSFLRLKNLQFGYTFPDRWMQGAKISKLRIYYSAENLFTITDLPINIDPESPQGNGANYPLLRTHSFGVTLSF